MDVMLRAGLFCALGFLSLVCFATVSTANGFVESKRVKHAQPCAEAQESRVPLAITCAWISYEVDGHDIRGFYVAPATKGRVPLPVIVFNRGGTAGFGVVTLGFLSEFVFPLAEAGFIVMGSQYRGAFGDGGLDEWGGKDVDDVLALLPIIDDLPNSDPSRIGIMGGSRGGMMAFLAASRSPRFKAVSVAAPATDLLGDLERRPEMERVYSRHVPGYHEDKRGVLALRSVDGWIGQIDPQVPILIQHGQFDRRVGVESSLRLATMLQAKGFVYRLVIYEGGDHQFTRHRDALMAEQLAWFRTHL